MGQPVVDPQCHACSDNLRLGQFQKGCFDTDRVTVHAGLGGHIVGLAEVSVESHDRSRIKDDAAALADQGARGRAVDQVRGRDEARELRGPLPEVHGAPSKRKSVMRKLYMQIQYLDYLYGVIC